MSQDYFNGKGKGPARQEPEPDGDATNGDGATGQPDAQRKYMTVGSGSTSEHAARLQNLLDVDSGYGGSIAGDEHSLAAAASWDSPLGHDRSQSTAIHQLWYNRQRAALGRSINKVLEMLQELQSMNSSWPAHYPSVQRTGKPATPPLPPTFHDQTSHTPTPRWYWVPIRIRIKRPFCGVP